MTTRRKKPRRPSRWARIKKKLDWIWTKKLFEQFCGPVERFRFRRVR